MSPPDLSTVSVESLTALLTYLRETASDLDSFAREQLPLLAQDILNWVLFSSLLNLFIWLLFWIPSTILFIRWLFFRKEPAFDNHNNLSDRGYWILASSIAFGFTSLIGIPVCVVNGSDVVKALVAPRLVILDYVTDKLP